MSTRINKFFTPRECIRLSRKFTEDEAGALDSVVMGIKIHGELTWYINHVPSFYSILYEFPAFRTCDVIDKLCSLGDFSMQLNDGRWEVIFKHNVYYGYNLQSLVYRAAILSLKDVTIPDLKR